MTYVNKGQNIASAIVSQEPDRSGNFVLDNAADVATFQAAIDYVTDFGLGSLFLRRGVNLAGQGVITDAAVNIYGVGSRAGNPLNPDLPFIQQIKYVATGAELYGITLEGFNTREVHFNADGQEFDNITMNGVNMQKNSTFEGILFEGDGTSNGAFRNFTSNGCELHNTGGGGGIVNFRNMGAGSSEIHFNDPRFRIGTVGGAVFILEDDARVRNVSVLDGQVFAGETTGIDIVRLETRSVDSTGILFQWKGGRIEIGEPYSILEIGAHGTNDTFIEFQMTDAVLKSDSGETTTLVETTNDQWKNTCYIWFLDNLCKIGDFVTGNLPNDANVNVRIQGNEGDAASTPINPIGVIIAANNKFTASMIVSTGGAGPSPVASTDYEVRDADVTIYTPDSGNNDCAVVLKSSEGVAAWPVGLSPNAFPGNVLVFDAPHGSIVNWGAFTGAAPQPTIMWN